jgi:HEPN domain-containing protein
MRRHEDWLKQADSDLCAAEDSASSKHYEWACFQAQQAAEKSLKALIISKGSESRIHSIKFLLSNLPERKLIDLEFRNDWIPEFINYIEQCIRKDALLILLFGSRAKRDFHKIAILTYLLFLKT